MEAGTSAARRWGTGVYGEWLHWHAARESLHHYSRGALDVARRVIISRPLEPITA